MVHVYNNSCVVLNALFINGHLVWKAAQCKLCIKLKRVCLEGIVNPDGVMQHCSINVLVK